MNVQDTSLSKSQADKASVYFAELMNPSEVDAAVASRDAVERKQVGGRWMFCGDVSRPMFELLRSRPNDIAFRVSGFKASFGGVYGVLTHQLAGHQHRFLLPLYEPGVAECIASLRSTPYGFLLGNDGQRDSIVLRADISGVPLLPLLALLEPYTHEKLREMLMEFPIVIAQMLHLDKVPSAVTGEAVLAVSVSVLMPVMTLEAVRQETEEVA
jgi:hypothetical protein